MTRDRFNAEEWADYCAQEGTGLVESEVYPREPAPVSHAAGTLYASACFPAFTINLPAPPQDFPPVLQHHTQAGCHCRTCVAERRALNN